MEFNFFGIGFAFPAIAGLARFVVGDGNMIVDYLD